MENIHEFFARILRRKGQADFAEHPCFLPIELYCRWEERAAILEHDAGHDRDQAEKLALAEINEMMQAEAGRKQG